ncbi:MAG: hypothetical protein HPY60_00375 [Candidatus Methanofastidiosum sp.]|nr:hypothetical protein [Methanofastidiosum sp.]
MFSLEGIMSELSKERRIFHSEADFQHALAMKISKIYPKLNIRVEYNPWGEEDNQHIDLWIIDKQEEFAIELKYKKRQILYEENGEKFILNSQHAQDIARYDFCKDIKKLESIKSNKDNFTKYVIFLTNDHLYWDLSNYNTNDDNFRIHDGKELTGTLKWHLNASEGTKNNRDEDISLNGKYKLKWNDYSDIPNQKNGKFRYLLVKTS